MFLLGLGFRTEPLWNVHKTVDNSYVKMDGGMCKFCGHTNCDGHSLPGTGLYIVPRFTSVFSTWTLCNDISKRRPEIPFAVACHEHTRVFALSEPTLSSLGRIRSTAKTAKAVCQRVPRTPPDSLGFGRNIPMVRLVYLPNVSETPLVSSRSKCDFKR